MLIKFMKTIIGFTLCCYALTGLATEIIVTTDRNPVNMNESFQITFSASNNPDGDPDFSPLHKDFEVLNQSHSSQSSWVNGSFANNIQWVLDVIPKKTGMITIPAINFGGDKSDASSILINKAERTKSDTQLGGDLFVLVDVSTRTPYVQQQVIYTMRLYRKVDLSQARLTEPKLADAVIETLGKDKDYSTEFQGEYYTVTERKYAIFPQKSGTMTITPLSLTAAIVVGNSRPSFGGFFNRLKTRTMRVASDAIELNVQPVPEHFTGKHWLPAEQVHLQEEWSNDDLKVNIGEPLTRTLTLLVKGSTVGQLPKLTNKQQTVSGDKLKYYPDQPILKGLVKENSMVAFREEKIALIPSQGGTYQLPEIKIPWWNTQTDQMEIAIIPAKTIQAIALPGAASNTHSTTEPTFEAASAQKVSDTSGEKQYAWMGLSAFLMLGWVLTTLYLLNSRQNVNTPKENEKSAKPNDDGIKTLKKACQENNAVAAKDAIIRWGQQQYEVSSLGKIAPFCSKELKEEILVLNQLLYSNNSLEWSGNKLWKSFNEYNTIHAKKEKPVDDKLEPLYRL